jgi:hypothetical protein
LSSKEIVATEEQKRIFEHNSKIGIEDDEIWDIDSDDDFDFDDPEKNSHPFTPSGSLCVSQDILDLIKSV